MLPSPVSCHVASSAADAAQSLLPGSVAGPDASPRAAGSVQTAALRRPDALVGTAAGSGVHSAASFGPTPPRSARAKPSGAGYAKSASGSTSVAAKASAAAKASGPLAFLDDPKLSIEDKLMRLLAYLNDKWDKDLDKKMKEFKQISGEAASGSSGASGTPSKSEGGILGSIVKSATKFFPEVGVGLQLLQNPVAREVLSKIGGPLLAAAATATGFPELAPLALRYGPKLVDLAAGVATSVGSAAGSAPASSGASGTSSGSGSTSDGEGLSSDRKAQVKLMEMQRIMDQQKEMFGMVSNLLKTGHETRMSVIQNLR